MTTSSSPNSRFKRSQVFCTAPFGGRGRRAVGRLAAVLGVAEQEHGADAELEILADLLHDVLEALLRDAGHRRDRLVARFSPAARSAA